MATGLVCKYMLSVVSYFSYLFVKIYANYEILHSEIGRRP